MKRFCSLLLTFALLFAMTGCLGSRQAEPSNKPYVIGFSQVGSESDWRVANTRSVTSTFADDSGYELIMDNARQEQDNQFAAIRRFILEGVDFILIAPTVEEGWDTILQEIRDANIPVIIMDRSVAVDDENLYLTNIGSDFLHQGNLAVKWLEGEIPADKTARILHLQGTIGATAQIMRTKALEDAAAKHSNWEITSQLYGDFTEAKAYEVMTEYLKTNKEIDVLYSENDNMTFGAMRALDEAGISYGNGGQVKIITFDATREALQYCHDGKINLCVECNPMFGPQIKQLIEKYRNGEEIPKHVYVDESAYTTQNITQDFVNSRAY